jgi:hypothetical protein
MNVIIRPIRVQPGQLKKRGFHFVVTREPRLAGFWKSLVAVMSREARPSLTQSSNMFRGINRAWFQTPARSLFGSSVINSLAVFVIVLTIQSSAPVSGNSDVVNSRQDWIYYTVPLSPAAQKLPRIAPAGPGGAPGQGQMPDKRPSLGSSAFHANLTAISKPLHPDNNHQTILQPKAPDVPLTQDFHLPNILPVAEAQQPRAPKSITWKAPAANQKTSHTPTDAPPPTTATPNPDSTLALLGPTTPNAALPVPPPPASSPESSDTNLKGGIVGTSQQSGQSSGDSNGVVVLSTDPSGASGTVGLPVGNRMGSFSISPYGNSVGSPGGVAGGSPGGGSGGAGAGGNGSVGVGKGNSGGGGGSAAGKGLFSISGTDGGGGGAGSLNLKPSISKMIIPLTTKPRARKNALTVSTGPMGGGGLGVYQALDCGKIYTIFLPMPGSNWTLQYCQRDDSAAKSATGITQNTTVHLGEGLVAPEPELQFDFQRLPVPIEQSGKMIVLKGEIRDDGTIANVKVYAGVLPAMDEVARLAFSMWKFTPATRSGKPVTVMFLVGIDSTAR